MIRIFGCKRVVSLRKMVHTVIVPITVSMALSCLFLAGCKKRVKATATAPVVQEKVYTNRMNNAAYVESLKNNRLAQMTNAMAIHAISVQMDAYSNRVMAALSAGTNAAALDSALAKDEAWQKLKAQSDQAQKADRQTVAAARELVRQALLEEARAKKAVAEGKANPIDEAKTK